MDGYWRSIRRATSLGMVVVAFMVLEWAALTALTPVPAALAVSSHATTIAAGYSHACTIRSGKAYCWGSNTNGELGNNTTSVNPVTTPVAVDTSGVLAGKTLTKIVAGQSFTCALDSTGKAYCWGWNPYGQLGDASFTQRTVPVAVSVAGVLAGKTLTEIGAGNSFACVLDNTGKAYCWGYDGEGELGDNSTTNKNTPVAVVATGVLSGKTLTQIGTGYEHTCVLDNTGKAYCWGYNSFGQLGNNSTTQSLVPVTVTTLGTAINGKTLTEIRAGNWFTCTLDSAGLAYCWGNGANGRIGNNSTLGSLTAVAVTTTGVLSGKTINQLTSGGAHACALDSAGLAYCWGYNSTGQLGNNSTTQSLVPATVTASGVLSGKTITQISGGQDYTCALDSTNTVYCWGANATGQLGDQTTTQRLVAVLVTSQPPTAVVATPGDTTAAISWTAPEFLNSSTGYTATASPGGAFCTTAGALNCTITGLTNGTTYTITVVTLMTVGTSGPSVGATVVPVGILTITVPTSANLGSAVSGDTISVSMGTVTVADSRAGVPLWTATVTATNFTTGGGSSAETITNANVSYWSGPSTAQSGGGTRTPGQPLSTQKVALSAPLTAFSGRKTSLFAQSTGWQPTLVITIPDSAVAGTYTGTITHSVA
ncbi:RCC1 domain-containing protein [Nonomuraea aurantiaca]|jgi:alpha-tubulin suppressor-like RCC1 family protein|uniref:RCC1 domain-containing protein n=1 Tax=Nonomuraea aurantiaca TaxID=2878562 RepID=UPI001CD9C8B2|nr:hypothetical protein [Nonomuraea aurantiaca]MCA2219677.1 hypothetical protein [Nonomuraea aurantiaca]